MKALLKRQYSRGEGVVLPLTADALTVVGLLRGLRLVVEVQLVEAVSEGQQHLSRKHVVHEAEASMQPEESPPGGQERECSSNT